jgi:hypothetical protein
MQTAMWTTPAGHQQQTVQSSSSFNNPAVYSTQIQASKLLQWPFTSPATAAATTHTALVDQHA